MTRDGTNCCRAAAAPRVQTYNLLTSEPRAIRLPALRPLQVAGGGGGAGCGRTCWIHCNDRCPRQASAATNDNERTRITADDTLDCWTAEESKERHTNTPLPRGVCKERGEGEGPKGSFDPLVDYVEKLGSRVQPPVQPRPLIPRSDEEAASAVRARIA